jgi:hypothetical protein
MNRADSQMLDDGPPQRLIDPPIPLNGNIMSDILEDQQMLRFNSLGDVFPEIKVLGYSVQVAMVRHLFLKMLPNIFIGKEREITISFQ